MPLVRIDAVEGHSETEIQTLLHAAHRHYMQRIPPC